MVQIPFDVRQDGNEWFVHWPDGYKLATFEKGQFNLKGEERLVTPKEMIENQDTLILGELGGGASRFLRWLQNEMEEKAVPYALVRGDFLAGIKFSEGISEDRQSETNVMLEALFKSSIPSDQVIKQWAQKIFNTCHLIFDKLTLKAASNIAGAMRVIRESPSAQDYEGLHVIIFSTSEDSFLEQALQSAFMDFCKVFRLPRLNQQEVSELLEKMLQTQPLGSNELEIVLRLTGGHPALVKGFVHFLSDYLETGDALDSLLLNAAFDEMSDGTTYLLEQWKDALENLLEDKPDLKTTLEKYLGESLQADRLPPPMSDRPLYVAGWVGLDHNSNWGIVSDFHRVVISKVLGAR